MPHGCQTHPEDPGQGQSHSPTDTCTSPFRSGIRNVLLLGLLFQGPSALAVPTIGGIDGGIELPGWTVAPEGVLRVWGAGGGGQASPLFSPHPNRFYAATMTVLPGLEINARFTEAVGLPDPTITLPNYVDRMLSVKWAPDLPPMWPRLALGVLDLVSINELNRLVGMVPGSSTFGRGIYLVTGGTWAGWVFHAGVLARRLDNPSPYASALVPLGLGWDARLELGPRGTSAGVGWAGPGGWNLLLARIIDRDWAYGLSWNVAL